MKTSLILALLLLLTSCKATTNTLARWGGAGAGAVAGGAVAGPVGAGVGAVAGDALGDSLIEDPPTTEINNSPGGTIYAQKSQGSSSWLWSNIGWLLLAAAAFRFREHLWNAATCLFYGGWKEAITSILAIFVGGKVSHKATSTAGRLKTDRRVKIETHPHAMPPQSK